MVEVEVAVVRLEVKRIIGGAPKFAFFHQWAKVFILFQAFHVGVNIRKKQVVSKFFAYSLAIHKLPNSTALERIKDFGDFDP